jgi:ABC-type transport system substrate-binding protein
MNAGAWFAILILLASCGLAWFVATTRQRVRHRQGKALAMLGAGALLAWFAWWGDARIRRETLFEVVTQGSLDAAVGAPAPEHRVEFTVLHPGIEHRLIVYPEYPPPTTQRPSFLAEVAVRLLDSAGTTLVDGSGKHEPRAGKRYWDDAVYPFVPTRTGRHTLLLRPLTVGIPAVHVRIVDPSGVPDGRRAAGY